MLPDPRANPTLLGHQAAEATLLRGARGGRLHHAWLITGPEGVGKATLAYPLRPPPARRAPGTEDALALRPPTRCSAASPPARMPTC